MRLKTKRVVLACHQCREISCFTKDSEDEHEFFNEHFKHGKFTAFNPDREDGRRHAIMAGIPYQAVNDYRKGK